LWDRDPKTRGEAAQALSAIGQEALPELLEALRMGDDQLKRVIVGIYWHVGPPAKAALPELKKLRRQPGWDDYRSAVLRAQAIVRGELPTGNVTRVTDDLLLKYAGLIEKSNDRDMRLYMLSCWPRSKPQPGGQDSRQRRWHPSGASLAVTQTLKSARLLPRCWRM
jgi:hypothetical protein